MSASGSMDIHEQLPAGTATYPAGISPSWISYYNMAAPWTFDNFWGGWTEEIQVIPSKRDHFNRRLKPQSHSKVQPSRGFGRIITCNGHRMRVR